MSNRPNRGSNNIFPQGREVRQASTKDKFIPPGKPPLPSLHRNRGTGYHIPSGGFPLGPEEQDEAAMLTAEASDLRRLLFPCTAPSIATGSSSPTTGGKVFAVSLSWHPHTTKYVLGQRWTGEKHTAHSSCRKPFASCQHHQITFCPVQFCKPEIKAVSSKVAVITGNRHSVAQYLVLAINHTEKYSMPFPQG